MGPVGDITNVQVGTATADDGSAAAASVDQAQDVTISQSNVFGNGFFCWGWWWF